MARYTDSVCRMCRREGMKLLLKGTRCFSDKCAFERREYGPGVHGRGRRGKPSDYASQLREKQKIKRAYGLLEKQFRRTFYRAAKMKGITGENLLQLLERRLDNCVYRMGFATSRNEARQLVSHGHFCLNQKKVTVPSITLKASDTVSLSPRGQKAARIKDAFETAERRGACGWVELDKPNFRGVLKAYPKRDELTMPMEEHLVVELYSK